MEKLEPSYTAGGNAKWCGQFEIVWQFLKMLNIELLYDPAIPLLGIYPKELKTYVLTNTCTVMFIAALIILAKKWKKPKYLVTEEWIKCGISIQWNIYYLVIGYIT